jgi:hypothetical protein
VTLAALIKEATKGGVQLSGAIVDQDGKIELRFGGEHEAAPAFNPWDAEIEKLTKQ